MGVCRRVMLQALEGGAESDEEEEGGDEDDDEGGMRPAKAYDAEQEELRRAFLTAIEVRAVAGCRCCAFVVCFQLPGCWLPVLATLASDADVAELRQAGQSCSPKRPLHAYGTPHSLTVKVLV